MSEKAHPINCKSKPELRASVARTRLRRLEAASTGAVAASAAAAGLPLIALGALCALCKHAVSRRNLLELGSLMSAPEMRDALERRGLADGTFDIVVASLTSQGLLARTGANFTLPHLDAMLDMHFKKQANRSAGWEQRANSSKGGAQVRTPMQVRREASQDAHVNESVDGPELQASDVALAGESGHARVRTRAIQYRPGGTYRFGATDGVTPDEADPTVARVLCECGGWAEITQSYVGHLQGAYEGLDVLALVRRAAAWCDGQPKRRKKLAGIRRFLNSWLNTESREAAVRAAVVRSNARGNGFGQGGDYFRVEEPGTAASDSRSSGAPTLDFDDLTAGAGESVASIRTETVDSDVGRLSPVQAARARRSAPATQSSQALRPSRQTRLSEMLR